jgi:hypothetical protein
MAYAGQLITTDMFMPSSWTATTPSWTAATTNPAIGNGSIEGRYIQLGPLVWYRGKILAGSTTTFGSGEYRISLPVSASTAIINSICGPVWIRDASAADYVGTAIISNTNYVVIRPAASTFGGSNSWDPTHPITFASGDWISWSLHYEEA